MIWLRERLRCCLLVQVTTIRGLKETSSTSVLMECTRDLSTFALVEYMYALLLLSTTALVEYIYIYIPLLLSTPALIEYLISRIFLFFFTSCPSCRHLQPHSPRQRHTSSRRFYCTFLLDDTLITLSCQLVHDDPG